MKNYINFKDYQEKLKNSNIKSLYEIIINLEDEWKQNELECVFYHRNDKIEFYDKVASKIVECGEYPMDLHNVLLKNLSGKNLKLISDNINLKENIIYDYQETFLNKKDAKDCIDFIKIKNTDKKQLEQKILESNNADYYRKYIYEYPNANLNLFEEKLYNLIKNSRKGLSTRRERAELLREIKKIEKVNKNEKCQEK